MVSVNGDRGGFLFVLVDGWRGGCCGGFVIGKRVVTYILRWVLVDEDQCCFLGEVMLLMV